MIALVLCVAAFAGCLWAGKRSLGQGLLMLLVFGYFYGILRANLLTAYSHFIFDAGLVGCYVSQLWAKPDPSGTGRAGPIWTWTLLLMIWPVLLVFLPFQPLLISLVGLRGNILFIPVLLLGARLKHKDLMQFSSGLVFLNLIALAFAGAEYWMGLNRFYPVSAVTQIMYSSGDVEGGYYRIPAIFTSAHAYGGAMVGTMPFLIGLWQNTKRRMVGLFALLGVAAAMLGVLLSATRLNFVIGSVIILATVFTNRLAARMRLIFIVVAVAAALLAVSNTRFQRFKSLSDTDAVADRISGSVNRGFFEILFDYPMGNGLGGGGTSIPYFLSSQVRNPIGLENEYARILAEQGVIGLLIWVAFIGWFLTRFSTAFAPGPWPNSRRIAWCLCAFTLSTAWIGIGAFTAIPGTIFTLLGMGWAATRQPALQLEGWPLQARRLAAQKQLYAHKVSL